jgi:WD40 repeat protein
MTEYNSRDISGQYVNIGGIQNIYFLAHTPRDGAPYTVPSISDSYVNRPAIFDAVRERLLNAPDKPVALQGNGGFGKTTLAIAVAREKEIHQHFTDGILWVEFGESPDVLRLLNQQIKVLDPNHVLYTEITTAGAELHDLLANKKVLMVLDDVWNPTLVQQFLGIPDVAYLLTTRTQEVTAKARAERMLVDVMTPAESIQLLTNWLDEAPTATDSLETLAAYLGHWALLLELVGGELRELVEYEDEPLADAVSIINRRLERDGFTTLDKTDPDSRNEAIRYTLHISLSKLSDRNQKRYTELCIFPKYTDVSHSAVGTLWETTPDETRDILRTMKRLSLFTRTKSGDERSTVRLHDVVRSVLADELEDATALHARLIDNYGDLTDLPDEYAWRYIIYHLALAKAFDEISKLIINLDYLITKVHKLDELIPVYVDFEIASFLNKSDITLRKKFQRMKKAFVASIDIFDLYDNIDDVRIAFYSRFLHQEEWESAIAFLQSRLKKPYLLPRFVVPDTPNLDILGLFQTPVDIDKFNLRSTWGGCIDPGGSFVVSFSSTKGLVMYDVDRSRIIANIDEPHIRLIAADFLFSRLLVIRPNEITLWDTFGQSKITILDASKLTEITKDVNRVDLEDIYRGSLSGNGKVVVFMSHVSDPTIALQMKAPWENATLKVWHPFSDSSVLYKEIYHEYGVTDCDTDYEGRVALSAHIDGRLRLWNTLTGDMISELRVRSGPCKLTCKLSGDGTKALVSDNWEISLWEILSGEKLFSNTELGGTRHIALSEDASRIAAARHIAWNSKLTIKVWDAQSDNEVFSVETVSESISDCHMSALGDELITIDLFGLVKIWNISTESTSRFSTTPTDVIASNDDGTIIATVSNQVLVKLFDNKNTHIQTIQVESEVTCGVISDDNTLLTIGDRRGSWYIWSLRNHDYVRIIETQDRNSGALSCYISSDSKILYTHCFNHDIDVWEIESGKHLHRIKPDDGIVQTMDLDKSNDQLIVTSWVWGADTGRMYAVDLTNNYKVSSLLDLKIKPDLLGFANSAHSFISKYNLFAIVSADKVHVYDIETGDISLTFPVSSTNDVAFSNDGVHIAIVGYRRVQVWALNNRSLVAEYIAEHPFLSCDWVGSQNLLVAGNEAGMYWFDLIL